MNGPSEPPGLGVMSDREHAFVERTQRAIVEMAEAEAAARLDATFRELAPRRLRWGLLLAAVLVGGIAASALTWLLTPRATTPLAFDGGIEGTPTQGPSIARDPQGRLVEIATTRDGHPEGERLIFRGGRVVRIEHWRDGRLDGVATDFDGFGRPTRIETWREGVLSGPSIDLDPALRPRSEGALP